MLIKYILLISGLCISTPCFAKLDCESVAGITAGEASYIYETAEVKISSRLHFYSAPSAECQLPTFIVNGDMVEILRKSPRYEISGVISKNNLFSYVRYRDENGSFTTGWVMTDGLMPLKNLLIANPACQIWANKNMRNRESVQPSSNNHYKIIGNGRAWLYTMPNEQCRSPFVFLVSGDIISAQEQSKDSFIEIIYYTKDHHIVRGWLKKIRLQSLNTGDYYHNDTNLFLTNKAIQVITLNLRTDYQCIFYESWNEEKNIKMIVREDHLTKFCRGAGDPETSPAIDYISIDKLSGKVTRGIDKN